MNNSSSIDNGTILPQTMVALPEGALTAYNAYLSTAIAFGVPGNLLVLIIYLKSGTVTSTDWFIIFISIYDLISSLFSVPVYLTFSTGAWMYYGNDVICKLHMFISQSAVLSSTFLICGLAIERFYKVCRPNSTKFTTPKSKQTCVVISVIATALSLPCFVLFRNNRNHCGSVTQGFWVKVLMVYYTGMLLSFLSAVVILIVTYSRIALTILRSQINMLNHTKSQPKNKYRFGTFFAICCQENKIYPYDSSQSHQTDATRTCAVDGASKDKTSGPLNQIGSTCITNDNVNETDINRNGIETSNLSVPHDNDRGTEAVVCISKQTFCKAVDEFIPVYNNLEPTEKRPKRLPRIKIFKPNERESNRNHNISQPCPDQRTECTDLPIRCADLQNECPDHPTENSDNQTDQLRQTVLRDPLAKNTSQTLKTANSVNEIRRLRRGLKTTRIVFLICLIFVLSWIPPWASFVYFMFTSRITQASPIYLTINMFFRMTYLINTFSNPILYTALNKRFRDKLKQFICKK